MGALAIDVGINFGTFKQQALARDVMRIARAMASAGIRANVNGDEDSNEAIVEVLLTRRADVENIIRGMSAKATYTEEGDKVKVLVQM